MPDIFVSTKDKELEKPKEEKKILAHKKGVVHQHPPTKIGYLGAYCEYPEDINFYQKDPEECIVLLLRKHPITNVPWIVLSIIMLFAPRVLEFFPLLASFPREFQIIAVVTWYLLLVGFVFERFLSWFFNVYIVTDERVFDVDFHNLIYREISDANIDQIQDVTVQMGSVVRTLFNYGDVVIQTAAEIPQFEFEAVPAPDRVARILRGLRVEEEQEKLEGRVR